MTRTNWIAIFLFAISSAGFPLHRPVEAQQNPNLARMQQLQMQMIQSQNRIRMWQQAQRNLNQVMNQGRIRSNGYHGYANRTGMGGGYQGSTQQYSGNLSRNSADFNFQQKNGPSANGRYVQDGRGNFGASGMYRNQAGYGYGGTVIKQGNSTNVQGNYQQPGVLPGTVENYHAGANFQGRKSSFYSGGSINNASNGRWIAGANNTLSGQGVNRISGFNSMGVRGVETQGIRFRGMNSSASFNKGINAGGVVRQQYHARANRNQISGGANMHIGNNKFGVQGSVGRKGVNVRVQTPNIRVPKINAPKINAPKIRPSLSVGGRKIF